MEFDGVISLHALNLITGECRLVTYDAIELDSIMKKYQSIIWNVFPTYYYCIYESKGKAQPFITADRYRFNCVIECIPKNVVSTVILFKIAGREVKPLCEHDINAFTDPRIKGFLRKIICADDPFDPEPAVKNYSNDVEELIMSIRYSPWRHELFDENALDKLLRCESIGLKILRHRKKEYKLPPLLIHYYAINPDGEVGWDDIPTDTISTFNRLSRRMKMNSSRVLLLKMEYGKIVPFDKSDYETLCKLAIVREDAAKIARVEDYDPYKPKTDQDRD
jgi:hypothetical protein